MSDDHIKVITRTCLTCRHEPEWKLVTPASQVQLGSCKSSRFSRRQEDTQIWDEHVRPYAPVIIKKNGVFYHVDEVFESCGAWESKITEAATNG